MLPTQRGISQLMYHICPPAEYTKYYTCTYCTSLIGICIIMFCVITCHSKHAFPYHNIRLSSYYYSLVQPIHLIGESSIHMCAIINSFLWSLLFGLQFNLSILTLVKLWSTWKYMSITVSDQIRCKSWWCFHFI